MKPGFLLLLFLLLPTFASADVDAETCRPFYEALAGVPHESIFQRDGMYNSRYFETGATGCFLVMNTSEDRLGGQPMPDLTGEPGTPMYESGWRVNLKYVADGPGTSVVGLEKDVALCLVMTRHPRYINDDGQIVPTAFINVRVECLNGAKGENYQLMLNVAE